MNCSNVISFGLLCALCRIFFIGLYHVSCTDGRISVRIKLELLTIVPFNACVLSWRPFIVITIFSTGLVGCWKCHDNNERPTGKNTTTEWDDGEKGNSNLILISLYICVFVPCAVCFLRNLIWCMSGWLALYGRMMADYSSHNTTNM